MRPSIFRRIYSQQPVIRSIARSSSLLSFKKVTAREEEGGGGRKGCDSSRSLFKIEIDGISLFIPESRTIAGWNGVRKRIKRVVGYKTGGDYCEKMRRAYFSERAYFSTMKMEITRYKAPRNTLWNA